VAKDRVDRDDEDLVRLYLTDIGQYTLLTKDDEVRLAKAIEAGNEALALLDAGGELTAVVFATPVLRTPAPRRAAAVPDP
jgi:hypothetical protein